MARKAKIDNAQLKRFKRAEKKREIGKIPQREYYLIVCEGEKTEPAYFEALKSKLPRGVLGCIFIMGEGKNTITLIEETQKIRERLEKDMRIPKFDHTWAVFDKDNFPDEHFDNAINKGEQQKRKINCAWSNEAFELWYLLHFEYVNAPMNRVDFKPRIESWLSQKMGKPFQYAKNRTDMYELLQKFGDEKQAIESAEKLDQSYEDHRYSKQNPNTRLYLLVRQLNEMKQG